MAAKPENAFPAKEVSKPCVSMDSKSTSLQKRARCQPTNCINSTPVKNMYSILSGSWSRHLRMNTLEPPVMHPRTVFQGLVTPAALGASVNPMLRFASKNCGSNMGLSFLKGHCLLQKMISSAILSVVPRTGATNGVCKAGLHGAVINRPRLTKGPESRAMFIAVPTVCPALLRLAGLRVLIGLLRSYRNSATVWAASLTGPSPS